MSNEQLRDAEIRRMLETVEHDSTVRHPDRVALRDTVLAEYRAWSKGQPVDLSNGEAITDTEAPVIEIDGALPIASSSRTRSRWLAASMVTAAAAVVVVLAVIATSVQSSDDRTDNVFADLPALVDAVESSGTVGTGQYTIAEVADGVKLAIPGEVEVANVGAGFVELRPTESAWGSSLIIMTAEGSLVDIIDAKVEEGIVTDIRSVAVSSNGVVTAFEIRPTDEASSQACRQDLTCLAIGSATLDPTGVNLARQIDGPDGRAVWTLYTSPTVYAPFERAANTIVTSLEFIDE